METCDYLIVGADSAGCVMAYRLAERGHRVTVLEAGPEDSSPYIRIPTGFMKTYTNPALTWQFAHEGTPHVAGRQIPFVQGKTLGGSSAVNGTIYSRGQSSDYDGWAAQGATGWDYRSVLPYFRRNERFLGGGEDEFRGREGRLPIGIMPRREALCDAYIQGAVEVGFERNPDYNGRNQSGVGYTQATIHRGKRWSAAHSYLHPARRQWGVRVITHAQARRIVVEQGRAVGVDYTLGDDLTLRAMRAKLSTIISAGTVNTTRLLQLSGLGPGGLLQDLGIPVIADLPGVGLNLSDHYAARLVARAHPGVDTVNGRASGLPLVREVAAWLLGRPSILAMSTAAVYAFGKADPQSPDNQYALTFTPASFKEGMTRRMDEVPGVTFGAWRLRPESRGFVRLRSADPHQPPLVQANHLAAESDRRILIAALKRSHAILRSEAMRAIVAEQVFPRQPCHTDDEWLDFIRRYGMTAYHLVGTCRMGAPDDPMAVVDPQLRVRGIEGLRVVDASVMPTTPSGNTNAATLMIAEKAADMILGLGGATQGGR